MGHRVSKLQREELPTTDPFQSPTTPIPPATPKSSDPLSSSNPKSVIITICMLKVEQQPDHTDTLTMMPNATTGCDCWLTNNGPLTTHHSTHQRCTNAANASATIPIVHMSDITGEPNDDLNNANLISCCDNDKPPTFSATPTTVDPNDNANNNPPHIADQLAYYPVPVNQPTSDYQIMAKPDRDLHQHSTNANKDTTLNTGIPFDMISATNYKKTLSSLDTPTAGRASATATAMHENESFRPISHSQNLQQASLMEIAASFGNMSIDRSLMDKLEINESGDHCPACQDQQKTHRGANIKSPSTKRCCAKTHDPKEAKVKKTTNWKLNCAKLISGAKSSAMSSPTPSTATTASSLPAAPTIGRAANRKVDVEPSATTVGSADIPLEPQTPTAEPTPFWPTTLSAIDLREKATSKEDLDQVARIRRAHEIARGVDPPPGYMPMSEVLAAKTPDSTTNTQTGPMLAFASSVLMEMPNGSDIEDSSAKRPEQRTFHSQVDFIHCLVPDLKMITSSCFYWGKMDRYEAERLLDGKPEGTFLLRDSAQEDFLFSVSFRKYNRSLHARIEQFNHKFSFDCHDPAVATSSSVTGLLEKYKNPQLVMFFEPALTLPLTRNFVFPLQQLCRATIVSQTSYDGIGTLSLPATLKSYLKEYHYKQRVRVNCFE